MPFHEIDLTAFEKIGIISKEVEKSEAMKLCGTSLDKFSDRCFDGADALGTNTEEIAQIFTRMSDKNACMPVEYHDDRYQYAVRVEDSCRTSAQHVGIIEVLSLYADKHLSDRVCGVQCMRLTHSGDWEGYVVFGASEYDWEYYLDRCVSMANCEKEARMRS